MTKRIFKIYKHKWEILISHEIYLFFGKEAKKKRKKKLNEKEKAIHEKRTFSLRQS
jgi:zona occludens toxin (predicted ATPase)